MLFSLTILITDVINGIDATHPKKGVRKYAYKGTNIKVYINGPSYTFKKCEPTDSIM